MEPEASPTFISKSPVTSFMQEKLSLARDTLVNRVFLGCYEERRYVVKLKEYRDVVIISPVEIKLMRELDTVMKSLKGIYGVNWVGITGPEKEGLKTGHCLWVKLTNVPLGYFWFQIRQLKYEDGEIILRLKCLRSVRPEDYEGTFKETIPKSGESKNSSEDTAEYSFDFDPAAKIAILYGTLNDAVQQVRPHITWKNFLLVCKFIFAMVFVLISAILTSIRYLGDYFLRLVRELTLLLQVLVPIVVQVVDCLTKTIGGFFILIALMFRGRGSDRFQREFQSQQGSVSKARQDFPKLMPGPSVQGSDIHTKRPVVIPANWRERNQNLKMQFLS